MTKNSVSIVFPQSRMPSSSRSLTASRTPGLTISRSSRLFTSPYFPRPSPLMLRSSFIKNLLDSTLLDLRKCFLNGEVLAKLLERVVSDGCGQFGVSGSPQRGTGGPRPEFLVGNALGHCYASP